MKTPLWLKICVLLPGAIALAGCAARTASVERGMLPPDAVHPALVSVGGELQEIAMRRDDGATWENFRNERGANGRVLPLFSPRIFLEVRHREHLSTINGQPREYSSTTTRSIRREFHH